MKRNILTAVMVFGTALKLVANEAIEATRPETHQVTGINSEKQAALSAEADIQFMQSDEFKKLRETVKSAEKELQGATQSSPELKAANDKMARLQKQLNELMMKNVEADRTLPVLAGKQKAVEEARKAMMETMRAKMTLGAVTEQGRQFLQSEEYKTLKDTAMKADRELADIKATIPELKERNAKISELQKQIDELRKDQNNLEKNNPVLVEKKTALDKARKAMFVAIRANRQKTK